MPLNDDTPGWVWLYSTPEQKAVADANDRRIAAALQAESEERDRDPVGYDARMAEIRAKVLSPETLAAVEADERRIQKERAEYLRDPVAYKAKFMARLELEEEQGD